MSYRLTGRKTGTVTFSPDVGTILRETATRSSKMTSNTVEGGSSIEDHVYLNPEQLQLEGIVVKHHSSFRSKLESMWKTRDLVTYIGKIRVSECVITSLQIKNDPSNKTGFRFTATLQKANVVANQYVELGQAMLMSQQDTGTGGETAGVKGSQTSATRSAGLKTTVNQKISQSAYAAYVDSYSGKSSTGPSQRKSESYDGLSGGRI